MAESQIIRVFPVVHRIREEIDFCFSAFYGNMINDASLCRSEFSRWLKQGFRGPGELVHYIEQLARHLDTETQKSIFKNLAVDAISLKKKVEPEKKRSRMGAYRTNFLLGVGLLLVMFLVGYFVG